MLIERHEIVPLLAAHGIKGHSVLHIGAHDCEELGFYNSLGIRNEDVFWVDAIQEKVDAATTRGVPNAFYGVMSDSDGETVSFKRTNNDQSSSILELGTHATHYPWITVSETRTCTTTTVDTFLRDKPKPNFWNLDIQGAELKALQGGVVALRSADVVYTEVNTEPVYQGCALLGELDEYLAAQGFTRVALKLVEQGWGDAMYVRTGPPPPLIFDIGANVGNYALAHAADSIVVSVEASPSTFAQLALNTNGMKNIKRIQAAVCNSELPTVEFYHCEGAHTLSSLDKNWLTSPESRFGSYGPTVQPLQVPAVKIDALITMFGMPSRVKVDVEGAEDVVISSLTKKVPVLCFEWAAEWYAVSLRVLDHLSGLGFTEFHVQDTDAYTYLPPQYEYTADQVKYVLAGKVAKQDWGMVWAR
jgi:FkbM family methyltransferase